VRRRRTYVSIETEIAAPVSTVTPEHEAVDREKMDIMLAVLRSMSDRDREVLTRFYLHEQSPELICRELNLTATQFRLLKSRAKERFAELGKTKLAKRAFIERFRRKPTLM
jgi:DNA-directed RNA polymerase specialized sigma24 family protein